MSHRAWCRAYRALLPLLPPGLRTRQGEAMIALFDRELQRRHSHGVRAVWSGGVSGLADLVLRGVHERVSDERRAMTPASVAVLRRIGRLFLVTSAALTALFVAKAALIRAAVPLSGTVSDAVLFSIPYTAALTIPMSVFIAVLWAVSRRPMGTDGDPASGAVRLAPVMGMASVVALCCLVLNAELVPRANLRLQAIYSGQPVVAPSDRSMTLRELRDAQATIVRASRATAVVTTEHGTVATLEVEVQKKFALAAACVPLALLAMGIARRMSSLRVLGIAAISGLVFGSYYVCLIVGEQLVDGAVLPPTLAMWSANVIALAGAMRMLRAWHPRLASSRRAPG